MTTSNCYNTNTGAPPLSTAQVVAVLKQAGMPDAALPYWLANLWVESAGFQPGIDIICTVYQGRPVNIHAAGLFQANLPVHPEIDADTAHDPYKAACWAADLSGQWTDFTPWEAWTACAAQRYVQGFAQQLGMGGVQTPPCGVNHFTWPATAPPRQPPREPVVLPADFNPIVADLSRLTDDVQTLLTKLGIELSVPQILQGGEGLYAVAPGDSLSSIAAAKMGSADNWIALYAYNQNVIGDDPNTINPGTVLRIPPGY